MFTQLKFYLGAILVLPFLPLLLWQGKRLRSKIPDLPEAAGPRKGYVGANQASLNVLILGESTMAGVGVSDQREGIAYQIAHSLHLQTGNSIQWQVVATSAFNAKKALKKLVPQIPNKTFDIIIIGLGVNDTIERNSPIGWKRDLGALLNELREHHSCPIVLAHRGPVEYFPAFPYSFKLILGNLIQLHWQIIQDLEDQIPDFYIINDTIRLEDWADKVGGSTNSDKFFSDGVHPSKMTYQLWGEEIASYIIRNKILLVKT